jgi:hypothetical protein
MEPWRITRTYGCNTVIASEHLLTFRSGAADLRHRDPQRLWVTWEDLGVSYFNLIIADGVLNAPNYTHVHLRHQNQTSWRSSTCRMEMWAQSHRSRCRKETHHSRGSQLRRSW